MLYYSEHAPNVIKIIKQQVDAGVLRSYYLIQHEPEEEGQIHYHCVLEYWNAKTVSSVAKNLELEERFVKTCSSVRSSCAYLIHKYDKYKKQYDLLDVHTNDRERYFMFIATRNDIEAQEHTQLTRKCNAIIYTNRSNPWFVIWDILCNTYDIDTQFLRKNCSCLYKYWESAHYTECAYSYDIYNHHYKKEVNNDEN